MGGAADAAASVGALAGDNSVWLERVAVPVFGAFVSGGNAANGGVEMCAGLPVK